MIQLSIISVFVLIGIIVAHNIFGGLVYKTKSFSSSLFSNYSFKSEFKEISNKKDFLKSSSSITAKLILKFRSTKAYAFMAAKLTLAL